MTTTDKHFSPGRWAIIAIVFVFVLAVLAWATMEQRKSIYKTAEELGGCKTFIECVQKAGLSGILEKDGPFSVFIPTDEAFSNLSSEQLTKILNNKSALTALLLYHMVPKTMTPTEMENYKDCMTCTVPQTSISCTETSYGKGKCVRTAVPCTNGMIYLIDSVQIPPFLNNKTDNASGTGQNSSSQNNTQNGQAPVASESLTIIESVQTTPGTGQNTAPAPDAGNSAKKADTPVKTTVAPSGSDQKSTPANSPAVAPKTAEPEKTQPAK